MRNSLMVTNNALPKYEMGDRGIRAHQIERPRRALNVQPFEKLTTAVTRETNEDSPTVNSKGYFIPHHQVLGFDGLNEIFAFSGMTRYLLEAQARHGRYRRFSVVAITSRPKDLSLCIVDLG